MKVALRDNQDFWAGVMLVAVGATALVLARNYPFGTSLRMGPGYFPSVLGSILCLFGLALMAKSLRSSDRLEAGWSLRSLIVIPVALVLFGLLMTHAGFIPALMVLIFGSALASDEFKLLEVTLLTIGLTIGCVVVFIYGLGLPYPLLAEF